VAERGVMFGSGNAIQCGSLLILRERERKRRKPK
jgi:hypothetical protein